MTNARKSPGRRGAQAGALTVRVSAPKGVQVEVVEEQPPSGPPAPIRIKVVLYPDGTGGYTVVAKALPGCIAEGDTREEALAEFREALQGYLLSTSGAFEMEEGGLEEDIEL